jgi:hypothetical protein
MQERKDFSWEQVTYAPLTHTFAILMILTLSKQRMKRISELEQVIIGSDKTITKRPVSKMLSKPFVCKQIFLVWMIVLKGAQV